MRRDNAKRSVAPAEKRDAAILSTPSRHTSEGGALVSDPVEAYFTQLRDIRSAGAGVAEISYYELIHDAAPAMPQASEPVHLDWLLQAADPMFLRIVFTRAQSRSSLRDVDRSRDDHG